MKQNKNTTNTKPVIANKTPNTNQTITPKKTYTILVVGGAGYIGSHTVQELVKKGHKVIVYDNLIYGHQENVSKNAIFIKGDIKDKDALNAIFKKYKIDAVMHFAGFIFVGESVQNPRKYYENNIQYSIDLLGCMLDNNVKKIIFSSSAAVYGMPKQIPMTEEHPKDPINPYGKTKLMFEQILDDYDTAFQLKSVCLRYFNAAGASFDASIGEDHDPETHIIPLIMQTLLGKRKSFTIFGNDYHSPDKTCIRDYIHIVDIADAHVKAVEYLMNDNAISKKYNLGTSTGKSNLEIIKAAEKISGKKLNYTIGPRREGDPDTLVADYAKIKKELNWNPTNSSTETIMKTAWAWHKKIEEKATKNTTKK